MLYLEGKHYLFTHLVLFFFFFFFFFLVLAATLQIIAFCYRLLQQDTYATKRLVDVIK